MPKGQSITGKQLMDLLQRQGYRCAYTGKELTPDTASLDHITPLSSGGIHDITNLAIVRSDVNAAKGTMPLSDFIAMCRAVADHADGKAGVPRAA